MVDIDSLRKKSPFPLDANTLKSDGTPFTTVAAAHASVSEAYICVGDVRLIDTGSGLTRYFYKGGKTINHLVPEDLASTSNLAPNLYKRVSDTLYDVLDQYTSKVRSWRKTTIWWNGTVMNDSKVDGVYYVKSTSGEYFVDADFYETGFTCPERFGAIGNGISNDTAAIKKCLTLGGKTVFRAGAVYFVNDSIYQNQTGFTYIIEGNGATIRVNNTYTGAITSDTLSFDGVLKFYICENITIRNLTIDFVPDGSGLFMGQSTWQTKKVCGILAYKTNTDVLIENVIINRCPCSGLYIEGDHTTHGRSVKILKPTINLFYRIGIITGYNDHVVVEDFIIIGTGDTIGVNNTSSSNIPGTMMEAGTGVGMLAIHSGTVINRNGWMHEALDSAIKVETSDNVLYEGIHISRYGKDGLKVEGRGANPQMQQVRVVNCLVHDKIRRRPDGSAAILLHDTNGGIVDNNIIWDDTSVSGTSQGIRFTNLVTGGVNKNIKVTNNIVHRLVLGHEAIVMMGEETDPILERDLDISNNTTFNPVRFQLVNGKFKIHGNRFYNDVDAGQNVGITTLQLDKCYDVDIFDNDIRGYRQAIYFFQRELEGAKIRIHRNDITTSEGHAVVIITNKPHTAQVKCSITDNTIISSKTGYSTFNGIISNTLPFFDVCNNTIEGYSIAIKLDVGRAKSVVRVNGNILRKLWTNGIELSSDALWITAPTTANTMEIKDNIIENWNRADIRFGSSKAENAAVVVSTSNLVTWRKLRIMDNSFSCLDQFVLDAGGVETSTPTVQRGVLFVTNTLKWPYVYFQNNIMEGGPMVAATNVIANVTSIYGYNVTKTVIPGTITPGSFYDADIDVPVLASDNTVIPVVKFSNNITNNGVITARIIADGLVKVTIRNVAPSGDIVLASGVLTVILVGR